MPTTYDKESGVLTITHIPERVRAGLLCSAVWYGLLDSCEGACLRFASGSPVVAM